MDSEQDILIEVPALPVSKYGDKIQLIKESLEDIKLKKQKHSTQYKQYKKTNTIFKTIVNILNTLSVSSMVLNFMDSNEGIMVIALVASTISAVISALAQSLEVENKAVSHNSSYLQYSDIYRDVNARMLRNGLSSKDLDDIITDLNSRIAVVMDSEI